jgi:hypothetical protein
MPSEKLAAYIADYPTAVLSWVDPSGYPVSVRCVVRRDAGSQRIAFPHLSPIAKDRRGKACLLFHMHDERLERLRQMVVKGELVDGEGGAVVFEIGEFVTANGRPDTDRMPHANAPLHMLQFYRLGRRKAKAYLAKRGAPWPRIPFDEIERAVEQD